MINENNICQLAKETAEDFFAFGSNDYDEYLDWLQEQYEAAEYGEFEPAEPFESDEAFFKRMFPNW
jgi:hypothetical protein